MASLGNVLVFKDVCFSYPNGTSILNRVNLTVRASEIVAFIGPSGSGKTTLLRLAVGLEEASSGSLERHCSGDARRHEVAYVTQHLDLWPHLTALQNITLPLRVRDGLSSGVAEDRARCVLRELGLDGLGHRRPGELSGGQRQRVAIARAIVSCPTLLVLDEISAALDPETSYSVLEAVISAKPAYQTILLATHHLGFAATHADQVAFIESGKLIEAFPGHSLFSGTQSSRIRAFVAGYR